MISDKFDKALYINLAHRKDRRVQAESEFVMHGIVAERMEAVNGNPDDIQTTIPSGHVGCILSHLNCLLLAKRQGWETVLILEDDVQFKHNADRLFNKWWKGVPEDWDMLYLGGNHFGVKFKYRDNPKLQTVTAHVSRTHHTLTTHAYAVKNTMFDYLIELLVQVDKPVDVLYIEAQSRFKTYTMMPNLAWQRDSYSDITNRRSNHTFMHS